MLLKSERIEEYYEAQQMPLGGLTRARSETDQIEANRMEAQKEVSGRLGELVEDLGLTLPDDAADEDERSELYAVVASIFA